MSNQSPHSDYVTRCYLNIYNVLSREVITAGSLVSNVIALCLRCQGDTTLILLNTVPLNPYFDQRKQMPKQYVNAFDVKAGIQSKHERDVKVMHERKT